MSSRSARRRQGRRGEPPPIIGRTELIAAGVVFTAAALTLGLVFLLSPGGGDDDGAPAGSVTVAPTGTATGAAFLPDDDRGLAIVELGRQSVEALPNGRWPELYDAFTQEFQERCPREEFVAAGEADAEAQGDGLSQLRFVKLIDVDFIGDTATATIVGAAGTGEYAIGTAYRLENGVWKIAPAGGTSGCNGFTRLS